MAGCSRVDQEPAVSLDNGLTAGAASNISHIEEKTSDDILAEILEKAQESVFKEPSFEIVMVGDILLHDRLQENYKNEDGTYDYSPMFNHTASLFEDADLAMVNQEVIIAGSDLKVSGYPSFNASFEMADALSDVGVDVLCCGTNHAMDKGYKGIVSALTNIREHHEELRTLGIHNFDESYIDDNLFDIEDKETGERIRVGIFNYTYGTNGIALPADSPFAVDLLTEENVRRDITLAKDLCDFIIVCPHWGTEYRLTPDNMQLKWEKLFYELGVDLVIGTHPHVVEPVHYFEGEDGGKMLVYYSLGNYINWTSGTGEGTSNRMLGVMAQVSLKYDESRKVFIDSYGTLPLVAHVTREPGECTVYSLAEYSEDLAKENAIRSQDGSFSYEYLCRLYEQVFGEP